MTEPIKIPADKVDALAQRLQTSLKTRRPRTWLLGTVALVTALGGLALLAWWLYKPTEAPRLEVIVFDAVAFVGESSRLSVQLAVPDDREIPSSVLRGRECVFEIDGREEKVDTDTDGAASIEWSRFEKPAVELIAVRYVDVRHKQGSADQARLFVWESGSKILLVDVRETLAKLDPDDWATAHGADIPPRPGAATALQKAEKMGYRIAYLDSSSGRVLDYRKMRGWVGANRPVVDRFPAGPMLKAAPDSRHRITVVVGTAESAANWAGARVIALDSAVKIAGVRSVAGWPEVVPLLEQPKE
jgi:hypothetical protein